MKQAIDEKGNLTNNSTGIGGSGVTSSFTDGGGEPRQLAQSDVYEAEGWVEAAYV